MKNSPKNIAADIASEKLSAIETPYAVGLEAIGSRIGYGRSCQILGDLWDQLLEREYGISSSRGKMERRKDIEAMEAAIKSVEHVEAWEYRFTHSSATGCADTEVGPCLTYDKKQAFGVGCFGQKQVFVRAALAVMGDARKGGGDAPD